MSERAKVFIDYLQRNQGITKNKTAHLDDAALLLQLSFEGNCANWMLGHLIRGRNTMLVWLGEDAFWPDEETRAIYGFQSPPITGADCPHYPKEKLIADYEAVSEKLIAALEAATDDLLDTALDENRTIGQGVSFMVWHDSYHTGQLEYTEALARANMPE